MRLRDRLLGRTAGLRNDFHPYTEELVRLLESRGLLRAGDRGALLCTEEVHLPRLFRHCGYPLENVSEGSAAGRFDFVLSERALYDPDRHALRAKMERLLLPSGSLILITDKRVYGGGAQAEAFDELLRTHCPEFRERVEPFDLLGAIAEFFPDRRPYEDAVIGRQRMTQAEFLEHTRRLPIYPPQESSERLQLDAALRVFFATWSKGGILQIPFVFRFAADRVEPARVVQPGSRSVAVLSR